MLRRYCGEQRLPRLPKLPEVAGITLGRVMISRNRTNKILHKRPGDHGHAASLASRAGEVIRSVRASRRQSLWLSSLGAAAEVAATAAQEALQEVKMALEAQVLMRPPICSSALVVTAMKARRVAAWCDRSKLGAAAPRREL